MPPKGKGKKSKKQLEEEKRKSNFVLDKLTELNQYFSFKQVLLRKKRELKRSSKGDWLRKRRNVRELLRKSEGLKKRNAAKRKQSV